jgi:hypothetical protein
MSVTLNFRSKYPLSNTLKRIDEIIIFKVISYLDNIKMDDEYFTNMSGFNETVLNKLQ